ncbi:homeobox-leucine zipper protein HAT4-like [Apium graveolens]|uniref:homeobox-leucine zipper protein HAT4-like n=1 Tax=Apium graveolens TaxID=4045 RepID=UPI003D7AF139
MDRVRNGSPAHSRQCSGGLGSTESLSPARSPAYPQSRLSPAVRMSSIKRTQSFANPNNTISSVSGKRSNVERSKSDDVIDCEDEDGDNSRKKLRLSKDQAAILEDSFKEHNTLNPVNKQKLALAKKPGLRPRQVEVWFQERRAI